MKKLLCIYHANCVDGFGAAWVVREFYGEDHVEFHAATHGNAPPNVTDREVLIVDFSYKRPVLIEMAKSAKAIQIIDHHKSAERDLVDLPENVKVFFDMDRSGAGLTWDALFEGARRPWFIDLIEDRDLWRFKFINTENFSAWLFSQPYDFGVYDRMCTTEDGADIMAAGAAIRQKQAKDINELIASAAHRATVDGHIVPALNVPYTYGSDAGAILCKGEAFAAVYYFTGSDWSVSLRSDKDDPKAADVSIIATRYGGGGHANAAGFRVADISELRLCR